MPEERRITKIRAVAPVLPVADVAVASEYYRDKLGFAIRPVMPGSEGYWVIAERGSVEIHLVPADWGAGFCILVDNVDQMMAELQSRGAKFESGPMNQEYDMRDFAVTDLNGHTIRYWQPIPPPEFCQGSATPGIGQVDGGDDQPF